MLEIIASAFVNLQSALAKVVIVKALELSVAMVDN